MKCAEIAVDMDSVLNLFLTILVALAVLCRVRI